MVSFSVSVLVYGMVSVLRRFLGVLRHIDGCHRYFIVYLGFRCLLAFFFNGCYICVCVIFIFITSIFFMYIKKLRGINITGSGTAHDCGQMCSFPTSVSALDLWFGTKKSAVQCRKFSRCTTAPNTVITAYGRSNRFSSPSLLPFLCHSLFSKWDIPHK